MGAWTPDFQDVFATLYGSDATGGGEEIVTLSLRAAGQEDGQDADDADAWGEGCYLYRPKAPNDDGKCQALVAQIGPRKVAIATRDSRAGKRFGAMNEGDAVFGSPTGGGMFRANDDGATSMRVADPDGTQKAWVALEKGDGTILIGNKFGHIELGPEGFMVCLAGSPEYLSLKPGEFTASAPTCTIAGGSVALGVGASKPLAAAPITGTAGAGFVSLTPVLGVFVA